MQASNILVTNQSGWPSSSNTPVLLAASATLTFTAIATVTGQEQTIAVPGAVVGNAVAASPATNLGNTALAWSAWVSAAGVVSVRVVNPTAGSVTPSAVAWTAVVFQ